MQNDDVDLNADEVTLVSVVERIEAKVDVLCRFVPAVFDREDGELLEHIKKLEAKLDSLGARLDAGVKAPGTRPVSPLGERLRREIERRNDQPDRSMGAKWFGRLLGVPSAAAAVELELMVEDGLLYSRPFYRGKLYYRCGHGPAAAARRGGQNEERFAQVRTTICEVIKAAECRSQAVVEASVRGRVEGYKRQDFWRAWTDLRNSGHIVKNDDGAYVCISPR